MLIPLPPNEDLRLEALARYDIVDSGDDESFDRIARLAASLFSVPIALISIVAKDRVWFKSRIGSETRETPREDSFSAWTILSNDLLVVEDTRTDPRFQGATQFTQSTGFRFYAGAPLITSDGFAIGALAIIDNKPRRGMSSSEANQLQDLTGLIIDQLELRYKTQQLRASEADYRGLFENCPIGIYRTSPSGKILMVNPAILKMLDYPSVDELKSLNLEADELVAAREGWKKRLEEEGTIVNFENVWYSREGHPLQICETTKVVRDATGEVAYYEGWAEDISLQKSAEAEREKAQLLNQKLIEGVPDLIYIFDLKIGRSVFTNRSYFEVVGQDPDYVRSLADPVHDLVHPDDVSQLRRQRESLRTAAEGEFQELEFRCLDQEGNYRLLSCRETVFSRDEQGLAKELLGIIRDISKGRAIEERLRRDEERWELVLAANNDGLWDWDARTGETFHSHRWCEILGYSEGDANSMESWETMLHAEDAAMVQTSLEAYLSRKRPAYQEEYRLRTKDGSYRWVFARGVAQWDEDGNVLRMVGAHTDITERKEAELALRLQAVELADARDKAESAVQAKSSFLATMSHEIRTPLNGVLGMAAILSDTELTADQQDYLRTIRSSGSALLAIINDILDFSKIEAGHMELEEADFELSSVIEESLDVLAEEAHRKGIELAASIDKDVPSWVRGDSARLRQVLLNLLSNAVKFTQEGEVVLAVSRLDSASQETTLRFSVSDTGIGMSAKVSSRIFSAFSQADASTTRRFGGTGLGLAICKQLVHLMGGQIGVESQEGVGSTFWFHADLPAASRTSLRLHKGSLAGKRILVADDNITNLRIVRHQLESYEIEVVSALDGVEALSLLLESQSDGRPIDLALLDFQMPRMDGLMLARAIRSQPAFRRLPIVLLASVTQREYIDDAKAIDIQGYLVKPIRNAQLIESIRSLLTDDKQHLEPCFAESTPVAVSSSDTESGVRVLLAEDNPVNQKVGVLMLTRLGYQVDVVGNGLQAVNAFEAFPYQLILLDCQMPEMDGFEATRAIRGLERDERSVKIIALTANALVGERERCIEAGMDDYLSKPISMKALGEKLDTLLKV